MFTVKDLPGPKWTRGPWEVKDYPANRFRIEAPETKDAECGEEVAAVSLRDWWPKYPNWHLDDQGKKHRHPLAGQTPDYAEARANATLFAAAPELAKAVREYLEGLEDRVAQAERLVRGARELSTHGRTPYSVVMARMAEADARRALAAAQPLYAALAKAHGKEEG